MLFLVCNQIEHGISTSQPVNQESRERQMCQLPNANRRLGEQVQQALNKIKKPSTAEEISELLNRNLGPGDWPFRQKKVTAWLRNAVLGVQLIGCLSNFRSCRSLLTTA